MASHVGGGSNGRDPKREEYEDSTCNAQYPDDDANLGPVQFYRGVQRNHCRLFLPRLPKDYQTFESVRWVYISERLRKKYGLVSFQTPGEANLATVEWNKAKPWNLTMSIVYKENTNNNAVATPKRSTFKRGANVNDNREKYNSTTMDLGFNESKENNLDEEELSLQMEAQVRRLRLKQKQEEMKLKQEEMKLKQEEMKLKEEIHKEELDLLQTENSIKKRRLTKKLRSQKPSCYLTTSFFRNLDPAPPDNSAPGDEDV